MAKIHSLIPPYLNVGSHGSAVRWLVQQLYLRGFLGNIHLELPLHKAQEIGVKTFQRKVGLDEDGHFGQDSQSAWCEYFGENIRAIPNLPGQKTWWLGPKHKNFKVWPQEPE